MGIYRDKIFPFFMDRVLGRPEIGELRKKLLSQARGKTLEIGFGTGLNVPHYPNTLTYFTAIEDNEGMEPWVKRRLAGLPFPVAFLTLNGELLPFENDTFDTVVFTFTLCSIANVQGALREARRVLKPGGRMLFLEHGRAPSRWIAWWQDLLNPVQKVIGQGCHLNRDMKALIDEGGFKKTEIETSYFKKFPKILGYFYQGFAEK